MDALQVARSLEEVSLSLGPGLYYTRNNDLMTEAARAVESLLRAHSTVRVTFYRIDLILDGSQSHNHDVDITEDEDTILRSNIAASFHSRLMRVAPRISTPVSSEPGLAKSGIRPFNRSYASLEQSERGAIFSRIVRYAIEIPRGGYVRQESQEGTWVHLDGIDLQTAFALQMTSRDVKVISLLYQRVVCLYFFHPTLTHSLSANLSVLRVGHPSSTDSSYPEITSPFPDAPTRRASIARQQHSRHQIWNEHSGARSGQHSHPSNWLEVCSRRSYLLRPAISYRGAGFT